MAPKAYRWVDEMREIGKCFAGDGGFITGEEEEEDGDGDGFLIGVENVYDAFGEVYRFVSEGTVLGEETIEVRKRGREAEDVAVCVSEGLDERSRKKKLKM